MDLKALSLPAESDVSWPVLCRKLIMIATDPELIGVTTSPIGKVAQLPIAGELDKLQAIFACELCIHLHGRR